MSSYKCRALGSSLPALKKSIKLRPHHCLCLRFFEGKGYSNGFIDGVYKSLAMLEESGSFAELTEDCDIVCLSCPNNIDGVCCEHSKINAIDRRCLDALGLEFGESIAWSELKYLSASKVDSTEKLFEICRDCCWSDICKGKLNSQGGNN